MSDALKLVATLLQRANSVVEARHRHIGGDGIDLSTMRGQCPVESGTEVPRLNPRERRQLERAGPGCEQRILGIGRWGTGHPVHLIVNLTVGEGLSHPRKARSALKITATSITSCNSAPWTGTSKPNAAAIMANIESPMPATTLSRAI